MKRACTLRFPNEDENLSCEFHVTFKNKLFTYENKVGKAIYL